MFEVWPNFVEPRGRPASSASGCNDPFRFETIRKRSVVQAIAALARHDLNLLFVQDDPVKQRISGAEGPIGGTVLCENLIYRADVGDLCSLRNSLASTSDMSRWRRCMWPRRSGGGETGFPSSAFGRALLTSGLLLA